MLGRAAARPHACRPIPIDAEQVQLDGELLDDVRGMRRRYADATVDAIEAFQALCGDDLAPPVHSQLAINSGSRREQAASHLRSRGTGRAAHGTCVQRECRNRR